jgi:hypothetical protein
MTTLYEFAAGYTKAGVAAAPSSAPTITIVDSGNNILVAALTVTIALTNLAGAYRYSYSGADGLICYALFHTTDVTMDQQSLFAVPVVRGDAILAEAAAIKLVTDQLHFTVPNQVDANALSGGTSPTAIWNNLTRTLTDPAAISSLGTASALIRRRGDSWSISITGLGNLTGYTSIWFTAKKYNDIPDSGSVLQIKKNSSGVGDGLLVLNGSIAITPGQGSITVDNLTLGNITIVLDEATSAQIEVGVLQQDVQVLISGSVSTPSWGTLQVTGDTTRAIA